VGGGQRDEKTGVGQEQASMRTTRPCHTTKSNAEMNTIPMKLNVEEDIYNAVAQH
jgi:hypothetical protein